MASIGASANRRLSGEPRQSRRADQYQSLGQEADILARAASPIHRVSEIFSVVPANERPITGSGQAIEHLAAFGSVGALFAIGSYRLGVSRLLVVAFLFCGAIELLQVPLPTRHARVSDFAIDLLGSYAAIGLVMWGSKFFKWSGR
jgi:VanZ family protein